MRLKGHSTYNRTPIAVQGEEDGLRSRLATTGFTAKQAQGPSSSFVPLALSATPPTQDDILIAL